MYNTHHRDIPTAIIPSHTHQQQAQRACVHGAHGGAEVGHAQVGLHEAQQRQQQALIQRPALLLFPALRIQAHGAGGAPVLNNAQTTRDTVLACTLGSTSFTGNKQVCAFQVNEVILQVHD
eukprot:1158130-Pelagomonas_calceolata.AAC.16